MLEGPRCTAMTHQARGSVGVGREREDFTGAERIGESRESAAHEERLALPMAAHEGRDVEACGVLACH